MKKRWPIVIGMLLINAIFLMAEETKKIQDNSFLLEEAYNQEAGVVQHIQVWQYDWNSQGWVYSFTQEWPVPGQKHQLSFTIPVSHLEEGEKRTGLNDIALNYRYQLLFKERIAVAPRFSVLFPSGSYKKGMGTGSLGLQMALPESIELAEKWVTHWNLGCTYILANHEPGGSKADTFAFNYGASLIYLASANLNLMCEVVGGMVQMVQPETDSLSSPTTWTDSLIINPAFRYAFNFKSGLQIVAGLGFPIGIGPAKGQSGVLLYLSFEHVMFKI